MSVSYQGLTDSKLPQISKPSLQQYDNYQINDLYCDDIIYLTPPNPALDAIRFKNWLAVEKVSPYGTIECNFEAIAINYP